MSGFAVESVGGIIAAADSEAGRPLMQVGEISLIRRIVICYQQAGVFPVVIVCGSDKAVKKHLAPLGVIFLDNGENSELIGAAKLGLEYLHRKCGRVVFTPVSAPMFTPSTLYALMRSRADIAAPSYRQRGGHPVIIADELIPEILAYEGEDGLRGALKTCGGGRTWLEVEDPGILANAKDGQTLDMNLQRHNRSLLRPVVSLSLEGEACFFSQRTRLLLYLLKDTENMRQTCLLSGMAHSMAWNMINKLEKNLGYKVVERQHGGSWGGHTSLTANGENLLSAFSEFEHYLNKTAQEYFNENFINTHIIPS